MFLLKRIFGTMAQFLMDGLPRFGTEMPTVVSLGGSDSSMDGLQEEKAKLENISFTSKLKSAHRSKEPSVRLNKFVRRLHEMLIEEREGGVVEWRRGLLILHNINNFSKDILPKYFNTRNFKTFRRQLNYYGFLHVRSFSASGSATTALWVNQALADHGNDSISSVLKLKRVEPNETSKTPEGRRERKSSAACSVEVEGLNVLLHGYNNVADTKSATNVPKFVHCRQESSLMYHSKTTFERTAPVTQPKKEHSFSQVGINDPLVDHAAGLLLSLSNAAV